MVDQFGGEATPRERREEPLNVTPDEFPEQIGRYDVIGLIGKGGYAKVYKARLQGPMGFTKIVALKVTTAPESEDSKQVKALINEARVCGRLSHPNIVEVYEFGRWQNHYFIAMEYIQGVRLDELIKAVYRHGERLSAGTALEILTQVCRGLRYAHQLVDEDGVEHTVIHRDLKPANLMLTTNNIVKIMDFGIAKSAFQLTQTMEGFTKGTPMYMSPEQVQGAVLTPASDIYSLGVMLFEILTGKRLFAAKNLMQIIEKVASSDVEPDLVEHQQSIGGLMHILRKMLARYPDDRYDNAAALLQVLEQARTQFPAGPSIASLVERTQGKETSFEPPPAKPETGPTTPSLQAEVAADADAPGWSVVMPAISREARVDPEELRNSLSKVDQATVSLELLELPPIEYEE